MSNNPPLQSNNANKENAMKALSRRLFLRRAATAGAAAALASGAAVLSSSEKAYGKSSSGTQIDVDVLNFALNLEYLEAEFYLNAVYGNGLSAHGVSTVGEGFAGTVYVEPNGGVPFESVASKYIAQEIAENEMQHVQFIQGALTAAGIPYVSMPNIDLINSWNALAKVLDIGSFFLPFANETNFFLAAYVFEDVGVTAYNGAVTLLTIPVVLQYAASILAVEAYHGGILRLLNYQGSTEVQVIADKISNLRAVLGGGNDAGILTPYGGALLVPTDEASLAFRRTTREVLNIVYGGVNATSGLFFPQGLNGAIH